MRIFDREKKKPGDKNMTLSVLWAMLPVSFIAGLMLGFQLWGEPKEAPLQQADSPIRRIEMSIDETDVTRGPADAKVVMVEFTDYQCPFCKRYYDETFAQIIEVYGDRIQYVLKDLPLVSIHPEAVPSAIAAHCADEQDAFWEFHGLLFGKEAGLNSEAYQLYAENLQLDMQDFNDCLDSGRYDQAVMADIDLLTANGVPLSTPTFFINGRYIAGAQPFSVFADVIEAELAAVE